MYRIPSGRMSTRYYSPKDRSLSNWGGDPKHCEAEVGFTERSTVAAARDWAGLAGRRIGLLSAASPRKRGGDFARGSQGQEESIIRASNLYTSLRETESDPFYDMHLMDDAKGFYSHSMIYTKNVTLIRDEYDQWAPPAYVNVVTSAAVNARAARYKSRATTEEGATLLETRIENAMFDRMGRILKLFEDNKNTVLVLNSFGTGALETLSLVSFSQ